MFVSRLDSSLISWIHTSSISGLLYNFIFIVAVLLMSTVNSLSFDGAYIGLPLCSEKQNVDTGLIIIQSNVLLCRQSKTTTQSRVNLPSTVDK